MKTAIVALTLLISFTSSSCDRPKPEKPTCPTALKCEISDGSWMVGDEIQPGTWKAESKIAQTTKGVWFITPAKNKAEQLPNSRHDSDPVVILLRAKQGFTTNGCGKWRLIR